MQIIGSISVEEVQDLSIVNYRHSSRAHLLLPVAFLAVVLLALFGLEYYKDWKRKRRMNRIWEKSGRVEK